jgi:carbonic anhydrase
MIVACSDSRSAPETIFDAGPGELFVVRNVAGLVPVYAPDKRAHAASAALEYAVLALDVRSIVVMGHGRCGGIAAALEESSPLSATDFIGTWVAGVRDLAAELPPAEARDPVRRRLALELRSIEQSIANLRTFPWIRTREESGRLHLHGAWFEIAEGELHALTANGWARVSEA